MKYHLVVFLVKVTIHMPVPRNMEVWKTTICFLLYRLAFLYSCSYLKVSSKQENQDDLNGCSLVKHHSQVSSPLKLLARRAIKVWFLFISMDTPNQLYKSEQYWVYVCTWSSFIYCKSVDKKMNEGPTLIKTSTKDWSIEIFITYQSKKVAFYFDWFCESILEVSPIFP